MVIDRPTLCSREVSGAMAVGPCKRQPAIVRFYSLLSQHSSQVQHAPRFSLALAPTALAHSAHHRTTSLRPRGAQGCGRVCITKTVNNEQREGLLHATPHRGHPFPRC